MKKVQMEYKKRLGSHKRKKRGKEFGFFLSIKIIVKKEKKKSEEQIVRNHNECWNFSHPGSIER